MVILSHNVMSLGTKKYGVFVTLPKQLLWVGLKMAIRGANAV